MSCRAVIFDLDGVLTDTAIYHFYAWKALADELGIAFTEHDNEQLKGVDRLGSLRWILQQGNLALSAAEEGTDGRGCRQTGQARLPRRRAPASR